MAKKIRVFHILVKTREEAQVVRYDINHGMKFEDVAEGRSLCSSKRKGGDLGWVARGKMVKEFEEAAFALPEGELSKPLKTQFGWHVIKVVGKR